MPELPEVERARRLIERVAHHCQIVKLTCARDPLVFSGVSATRMHQALAGRTASMLAAPASAAAVRAGHSRCLRHWSTRRARRLMLVVTAWANRLSMRSPPA